MSCFFHLIDFDAKMAGLVHMDLGILEISLYLLRDLDSCAGRSNAVSVGGFLTGFSRSI